MKNHSITVRKIGLKSLALCGAVAALLGASSMAQAATYNVTNLNDAGAGSLRQAMLSANANPGADTISFNASLKGTITIQSALPTISDSVTIAGPGSSAVTVAGNINGGLFVVQNTTTPPSVTISGLTITNGSASKAPNVGGMGEYAGMDNYGGTLMLNDCVFTSCYKHGLYNTTGTVNFNTCKFYSNTSLNGFNSTADGGGIYTANGVLTLNGCTFQGNIAARGGSLFNTGGTVTINNTTFRAEGVKMLATNTFDQIFASEGGAIYNDATGLVVLSQSSLSLCGSRSMGGAISNYGRFQLTGCSINSNLAGIIILLPSDGPFQVVTRKTYYSHGGGVANTGSSAVLDIYSSTFSGNAPDNVYNNGGTVNYH